MVGAFRDCWREHASVPTLRQLKEFLHRHNYPFRTTTYAKVFGGVGALAKLIVEVQDGILPEAELYRPRKIKRLRHRAVPLKLRLTVFKRDGYRCVKCGADPGQDKSVRLEVDHIVAVAKDGKATLDNLQTLCWSCNQGKQDDDN